MKTVEKLLASYKNMKLGNHRLEIQPDGTEWYYYHATPIVKVDWDRRIVKEQGNRDGESPLESPQHGRVHLGDSRIHA